MQLKVPVCTSCVHLRKFIVPSAIGARAVSLFRTGVSEAQAEWSKNKSSRKWCPRPAGHSQQLATLKKRRQEASRRIEKTAMAKLLATLCNFGTKQSCDTSLLKVCKLCFDILCSCLDMPRCPTTCFEICPLQSLTARMLCALHARGLLCAFVHLV